MFLRQFRTQVIRKIRSASRRLFEGPVAFGIWFLVVWEVAGRTVLSRRALPPPSDIAGAWLELAGESYYWESLGTTLQETLLGFVLGASLGIVIGIALGSSGILRASLFPLVIAFENLPRVALAPVFLSWFGFGMTSKVALAAAICFFPVVINTLAAYDHFDEDRTTVMRVLGASRWQTLRMVRIPESMPFVFSALRVAITLALLGAIVAEFVSAESGMGPLIGEFTYQILVPEVFALVLSLGVVGLVLYSAVLLMERRVTFWANQRAE
jgi:NitT/TauT family transport system permease protein